VITDELQDLVVDALRRAADEGAVRLEELPPVSFERPRRREHGDWATNVALAAGRHGANPREVAQAIVDRLDTSGLIASVDIAGPGFLNFRLSPRWLHAVLRRAAERGPSFGHAAPGTGERINVEFVSSNPTGPVNVVSGRHAAVGDALANMLQASGHTVTREFYMNDAGRQIDLFAESIAARYLQEFGVDAPLPDEGYQGEYIAELAREIKAEAGDRYVEMNPAERLVAMKELGLGRMVESLRESLERFGTRYDVWFSERGLHESGAIEGAIRRLEEQGVVYEKDGAKWFRSSDFGDDKDRVVVRSNGSPTYLAPDIAYFLDKFGRGFDRLVYLLGADHHGTVPRMLAAAEALGFDRDTVEILLVQIVRLINEGERLKSSKRAGVIVELDELVAEVGKDAVRYTFLTRSIDAPLEFDIELAKQQAPENPVFYVQYAHARICSILRRAAEEGRTVDATDAPFERLEHPSEDELMRRIASYEEILPEAASMRAPQRITRYVEGLASDYSAFYRDCRVITDDPDLTHARLALCVAAKAAIASGLGILGVDAPERM
jgi:arginyl-tRNA synthetase